MKVTFSEKQKSVSGQRLIYLLTGKTMEQFVRGLDNELHRTDKRKTGTNQ